MAAVEIVWAERNSRKLLVPGIKEAASTSVSGSDVMSAQVVDDNIDVNPDVDCVTSADHVTELILITGPGDKTVTYRLVTLEPRARGTPDHKMLIRWRHLDSTEPSWTEISFAFICDVRPFPVKEMDDHSSSGDTGVHVISNQLLFIAVVLPRVVGNPTATRSPGIGVL